MAVRRRGDLAGDLRRAQQRARDLPRDVAEDVEESAGDAVLDGAKSVRGTLSMSGLGSSLTVRTSLRAGGRRASVKVAARGPWGVASGTRGHPIVPTGRRRAVLTPKGPRARVSHPGTPKVDLWGRSVKQAQPRIDDAVESSADEQVDRVLGF